MQVGRSEAGLPAGRTRPEGGVTGVAPSRPLTSVEEYAPKSRTLFMFLGLVLGPFGIHNLYAGHKLRGTAQLLLTCLTLFYAGVVSWIWAIAEILVVSRDGAQRRME